MNSFTPGPLDLIERTVKATGTVHVLAELALGINLGLTLWLTFDLLALHNERMSVKHEQRIALSVPW